MVWLAILFALHLVVHRAPSAKAGARCLMFARLIPIRCSWIGALLVGATFLIAQDASRQLRSYAYLPLLVLAGVGPILLSLRPLWTAIRVYRPEWALRHRVILMASTLLVLTVLVGSIDFAARNAGYLLFVKTGRCVGETCGFSLWT